MAKIDPSITVRFGFRLRINPGSTQDLLSGVAKSVVTALPFHDYKYYTSGIINSTRCNQDVDTYVNIVGYGSEGDQQYWILRNSRGVGFADLGYTKVGTD